MKFILFQTTFYRETFQVVSSILRAIIVIIIQLIFYLFYSLAIIGVLIRHHQVVTPVF